LFAEIKGGSQILMQAPDCQGGGGGKKGRNWALENGKKRALITQNHNRILKITTSSKDWIDKKDGSQNFDKRLRPLIMRFYGYLQNDTNKRKQNIP
jgi:hypothetical protein